METAQVSLGGSEYRRPIGVRNNGMLSRNTAAVLKLIVMCAAYPGLAPPLLSQQPADVRAAVAGQEIRQAIGEALGRNVDERNPPQQMNAVNRAREALVEDQHAQGPALLNRQLRAHLQLAQTGNLIQFRFTAKQLTAMEQHEMQHAIANELLGKELGKAQQRIRELRSACNLTDQQARKLLLAAEANVKPTIRALIQWNVDFGETSLAIKQQVMLAQIGLRDLNETSAAISEPGNLIHKVFATLLTDEQTQALRASHLTWFSDFAFAMDLPVDQRQPLKDLFVAKALAVPLEMEQDLYCRQVMNTISQEELEKITGALFTEKIRNAKSLPTSPILENRVRRLDQLLNQ
jgi:hypothetical protein